MTAYPKLVVYYFSGTGNSENVARWLADHGITAFDLRYRVGPRYHHPIELGDVSRALRQVRSNAALWHLDPNRIGVLGFSAGGHLAASASTLAHCHGA